MSEDHGWKNFFYSRWFLIGVVVATVLVGFAFVKAYYQDYQVRQEIERLQYDASQLEAKKIESMEILKYVQSRDYVEAKARTDFNLAKPGEQVAVITGATGAATGGQVKKKVIELEHISNPVKWWRLFTNN
ncbi:MAG: septum formation initiator family protein [Patescibacteria group bacterium]|nr:septum formation initiator family protein [Patescibacteria group bacterium]